MIPNDLVCYKTDSSNLKGILFNVYFPISTEEIKKIILTSKEDIIPRGSGTNIVGSCIPNNSIVIDLKKMNKVTHLDKISNTVFVEPGITIKELNEKLKPHELEFPIFTNDNSTIGGIIAMNTLSDQGIYGYTKNWIEELEIINGRGEIIQIYKTDISDFSGMEGITGIITKAKLKLISIPKRSVSIYQSIELEEIFSMAKRLKLDKEVSMLKLYSPLVSKLLGFPEKFNLIILFNSNRGKIKGINYDNLKINISRDYFFLNVNEYYITEDYSFPYDQLLDFILLLNENLIPFTGEFLGNIALAYIKYNDNKKEKLNNILRRLNPKPGKFGIGLKRKNLLDPLQKKIIQRIKTRYDPFSRFNIGKLIDLNKSENDILISTPKTELKLPPNELKSKLQGESIQKNMQDSNQSQGINKNLQDYSDTFKPFYNKKEKSEIENYARKILGRNNNNLNNLNIKNNFNKKPIINQKFIQNLEPNSEYKPGKITTSDNLKRSIKTNQNNNKDIINKIMFNKYKDNKNNLNEDNKNDNNKDLLENKNNEENNNENRRT